MRLFQLEFVEIADIGINRRGYCVPRSLWCAGIARTLEEKNNSWQEKKYISVNRLARSIGWPT